MSNKLGTFVKEARTAKGLTQAALAEQVDGLTASDVSRIERGEKEPELAVLKRMARPLGVTQTALVEASSYAAGTAAAKKPTAAKTSTAAKKPAAAAGKTTTAKKTTTAGKTTTAKKTTAAKTSSSDALKLTATEKKLVELYRKANTSTKKTVVNILEGKATVADYAALALAQKGNSDGKTDGNSNLSGAWSILESTFGKLMK